MAHHLRLFAGPKAALRPFRERVPGARIFALTPHAQLFVMPLTDAVHDALHVANGTGEWVEFDTCNSSPQLTTTDMVFAARASLGSALVWLETHYDGAAGEQAACVWIDGALQMKPIALAAGENRPWSLRPINQALRTVGIAASGSGPPHDEFTSFGLAAYRSNDDILRRAPEVEA
jgi:hypothetical protein